MSTSGSTAPKLISSPVLRLRCASAGSVITRSAHAASSRFRSLTAALAITCSSSFMLSSVAVALYRLSFKTPPFTTASASRGSVQVVRLGNRTQWTCVGMAHAPSYGRRERMRPVTLMP